MERGDRCGINEYRTVIFAVLSMKITGKRGTTHLGDSERTGKMISGNEKSNNADDPTKLPSHLTTRFGRMGRDTVNLVQIGEGVGVSKLRPKDLTLSNDLRGSFRASLGQGTD